MRYTYLDEDKRKTYTPPNGCVIPAEPHGIQHTQNHVAYCNPGSFERDGRGSDKTRWTKVGYANIHAAYGYSTKL